MDNDVLRARKRLDVWLCKGSDNYFGYWLETGNTISFNTNYCVKYNEVLDEIKRNSTVWNEEATRQVLDDFIIEFFNYHFPEFKDFKMVFIHPAWSGFKKILIPDKGVDCYGYEIKLNKK